MAPPNSKIHFSDGATQATNKPPAAQKPLQSGSDQLFDLSGNLPPNPMASGGTSKSQIQIQSHLVEEDDTISEKEKGTYIVPNNEWTFLPQLASAIDESKYKFQANSLTVMNLAADIVTGPTMTTSAATTLTTDHRDQFYKCLAINALGQTTSTSSFRLSHNCK